MGGEKKEGFQGASIRPEGCLGGFVGAISDFGAVDFELASDVDVLVLRESALCHLQRLI